MIQDLPMTTEKMMMMMMVRYYLLRWNLIKWVEMKETVALLGLM